MSEVTCRPRAIAASPHLQRLTSPEEGVQISIANADAFCSSDVAELSALLSEMERARAQKFHFERDRQRYIVARSWLRRLLGQALDRPASELVLDCERKGKPRLVSHGRNGPRLRFNISHSGGWVAIALSQGRELGIDLEAVALSSISATESNDLAARIFSQREFALWRDLQAATTRGETFFGAWVRKEAYVKATGEGLGADLRVVEVLAGIKQGEPHWRKEIASWLIYELEAPSGLVAALAVQKLYEVPLPQHD